MIIDYHLIREDAVDTLDKAVKMYLSKGWSLYGDPFVKDGRRWGDTIQTNYFYQAVVLYAPDDMRDITLLNAQQRVPNFDELLMNVGPG